MDFEIHPLVNSVRPRLRERVYDLVLGGRNLTYVLEEDLSWKSSCGTVFSEGKPVFIFCDGGLAEGTLSKTFEGFNDIEASDYRFVPTGDSFWDRDGRALEGFLNDYVRVQEERESFFASRVNK